MSENGFFDLWASIFWDNLFAFLFLIFWLKIFWLKLNTFINDVLLTLNFWLSLKTFENDLLFDNFLLTRFYGKDLWAFLHIYSIFIIDLYVLAKQLILTLGRKFYTEIIVLGGNALSMSWT